MIDKVAFGQTLDAQTIASDEAYWLVAQLTNGGFFPGVFALGAVAAEVDKTDWEILQALGEIYGILIQIHDNLRDALCRACQSRGIEQSFYYATDFVCTYCGLSWPGAI